MVLDTLSYPIHIGALPQITQASKVLAVSDEVVASLYLQQVLERLEAPQVRVHVIPTGEVHKNQTTLEGILEAAFEAHLSRVDVMLALGGGVVSDLVGFASAIYKRGIGFYAIPTTLLAQVDASIGGKTGINNKYGKNLIGAFHPPRAVYIDPRFLSTLPRRAFNAGVAEMIKKAVCFDASYFQWLETHPIEQHLEEAIVQSVQIKARVVAQDEKEEYLRMGLNYGHTFGHAIEKQSNYQDFLHGEAVAIGMQMANSLACKLGLLDTRIQEQIHALLKAYHLNLNYRVHDAARFYQDLCMDKKNLDHLRFVLPTGMGAFKVVENVSEAMVLEVLDAWSWSVFLHFGFVRGILGYTLGWQYRHSCTG